MDNNGVSKKKIMTAYVRTSHPNNKYQNKFGSVKYWLYLWCMENTLLEMTDFGSEGIIVKQGNVQFVVIPVFELEGENGEYLLDSDVMNQEFQYKMDYLKSQYPKKEFV